MISRLLRRLLARFLPGLVEAAVEEVEAQLEPEEAHPITHRDVEIQQAQIREASKPFVPACSPHDCLNCGQYHGGLSCPSLEVTCTSPRAITERHCIPPPRPPRKR